MRRLVSRVMVMVWVLLSCSAYTPAENGGNRITASGAECTEGVTVACNDFPFGTKLLINSHIYTVQDRMADDGCLDIFMESISDAWTFGRQELWVEVLE